MADQKCFSYFEIVYGKYYVIIKKRKAYVNGKKTLCQKTKPTKTTVNPQNEETRVIILSLCFECERCCSPDKN